jgi:hypothetical protein
MRGRLPVTLALAVGWGRQAMQVRVVLVGAVARRAAAARPVVADPMPGCQTRLS